MKKVSIIIPVYNMEQYINECYESIINQTYQNLEILFIDDGSTDCSGLLCDEFQRKDKRVKTIHKTNSGVSATRNKGLLNATGDYVAFVDPDDILDVDMIQKLVSCIEERNVDAAFCRFHIDHIEEGSRPYYQAIEVEEGDADHALYQLFTKCAYGTMVWNKVFKRELIYRREGIIEFDETLKCGEDEVWLIEVIKNASKIGYLSDELYYWRVREESTYHQNDISDIKVLDVLAQEKALDLVTKEKKDIYSKILLSMNKKIYQYLVYSYIQGRKDYYKIFYTYSKKYSKYWYIEKNVSHMAKIKRIFITVCMKIRTSPTLVEKIYRL